VSICLVSRIEWELSREVYQPRGEYDFIDRGTRYQVKPGAALTVKMHHHRAEHRVVALGVGQIINGDTTFLLAENESVDLPIGRIHALGNPRKGERELIEVQTGTYLGEDDTVRIDDSYGRSKRD
jgi:mannose-6-phosphate isomerase-like protein (cupin superfamily)